MSPTDRSLVLGTAGHIDHGKTALVRALTGLETDRLEEERRRGISIDIGFAHVDIDGERIGIVDVPGHERFIRNMLAGACGVDVALLVVAADDSVMPQTREHLAILELLRVSSGIVAITKTDLVEPDWIDLVEEDVRALAQGSFLERAPIVRVSAVTGAGLDDLRRVIAPACEAVRPRPPLDLVRLCVDRSFMMPGRGTIVTGTLLSGVVSEGDELEWLPRERAVRVRGLQVHGEPRATARAGERIAINVTGAHHGAIGRGDVLALPGYLVPATRLTVRLRVLADSPWPIRHRGRVRLHLGSQEVMATIGLLEGTALAPGEEGVAQCHCASPVVAVARQAFVMRTESPVRTVGGGIVLQPDAPKIRRRDPPEIARLDALAGDDDVARAETAIYFRDSPGRSLRAVSRSLDALVLAREADVDRDHARVLIERLRATGRLVTLRPETRDARDLHRDRYHELRDLVLERLERLHAAAPLEVSVPRARLASRLSFVDRVVLDGVLDRMLDASDLVGDARSVALAQFEPTLSEAQRTLHGRIVAEFHRAGFKPPGLSDLAESLGVERDAVRPIVQLCVDQGEIVALGPEVLLHRDWERELRQRMSTRLRGLTVSEIKDVLETSRKYAVPMCEYLDRVGVTRRTEDRRVLAPRK